MTELLHSLGIARNSEFGAWLIFLVAAVLFVSFAALIHRIVFSQFQRLAKRTHVKWDDTLLGNVSRPSFYALMVLAFSASVHVSNAPFKNSAMLDTVLKGMFVLFLFWGIERIFTTLIHNQVFLKAMPAQSKSAVTVVLRVGLFALAALMILDSAGISITPLLASLGVGSVAVALALQDTLSNLFSGFYIMADKAFRVGDFVEIEGGLQGYVTKIGWRSTQIRLLSNNVVVVPNSKVASQTLTNFDLIDRSVAVRVPVGVSYASDLEKVEKVCLEVAKNLMQNSAFSAANFEPLVRFREFADSSINLTVILRAKNYEDQFPLQHEFIKNLHKTFKEEGIEIPFPQRVLHMQKSP
jgi:small-conductance mechanosensitive channel